MTPWTAAGQISLSITNSPSLLELMSIKSVMPANNLILCHPLSNLPSIFPSIRVLFKEAVLLVIYFIYSIVYMSIPVSQLIPHHHPPPPQYHCPGLEFNPWELRSQKSCRIAKKKKKKKKKKNKKNNVPHLFFFLRFLFLMWTIFKVFIDFSTTLSLF